MTNKTMGSKLADSLRQMRGDKPAAPVTPPPAAAPAEKPVATRAEAPRARVTENSSFARQSDQSPPASLDRPWANLHPARIWPD